jgi:hypothetical protein
VTPDTAAADQRSTADKLEAAIESLPPGAVSLAQVRDLVGSDGLMLLTAFLTIVFLVPVSVPGVSTVFGACILLIGVSRLFRLALWLPKRIERRQVATEQLQSTLRRGLVWIRRLDRVCRPQRIAWAASDGAVRVINDCAIILGAALLMAPFGLIPFSNTFPAIALLFLAIGSLQRDGLFILLGHVSNLVTIAYFALLIGGGGYALMSFMQRLLP